MAGQGHICVNQVCALHLLFAASADLAELCFSSHLSSVGLLRLGLGQHGRGFPQVPKGAYSPRVHPLLGACPELD